MIQDERQLAKIHGCVGPGLLRAGRGAGGVHVAHLEGGSVGSARKPRRKLHRLALLTAALAYLQLVLGANLRHMPVTASVTEFRAALIFHLVGAAAVTVHVILLAVHVLRRRAGEAAMRYPALILCVLVVLQLTLGAASWIVKYSLPTGIHESGILSGFTIENEGLAQSLTVTAHAAGGSLILAVAVLWRCRHSRLAPHGMETGLATVRTMKMKAVESTT